MEIARLWQPAFYCLKIKVIILSGILNGRKTFQHVLCIYKEGTAIPVGPGQAFRGFQEVWILIFHDNRHMKVVRLSALRNGRLYPPRNIPGTNLCWTLSQPQGHSAAGRIMSMKNCSDTIGNRTRELPTCCLVRQPTAPPRASFSEY